MCRSRSKGRTATTTLAARDFGRGVTACRESCNVLWPWDGGANRWGGRTTVDRKTNEEKTSGGKTPRSYLVESISIEPLHIPLGLAEPSGIDLAVQHTTGPQGPRSSLGYFEYAERPRLELVVMTLRDQISADRWSQLWRYAEQHGIGAKRSQDFGRFKVVRWDKLEPEEARQLLERRADSAPATDRRRPMSAGLLVRS